MILLISILSITPAFSQGGTPPSAAAAKEADQPKELSIYGEVQSVKAASNSIAVQYYDYDNDEEKTVEIILNKDTKMENAATLNDVKTNDWVDVTYKIIDGKNVAGSIVVEKEEELPVGAAEVPITESPEEE